MARYIDADALMEEINRIGGHGNSEWNTLGVKAIICRQDTADVVPRAEVEKWFRECEELQGRMIELEKEVAREIFAEIEMLAKIYTLPVVKKGIAEIEKEPFLYMETSDFDELKKKYTKA